MFYCTPPDLPSLSFQTQLTSVLEVLAKEAVDKICRLVSEGQCGSPVEQETLKGNFERMDQGFRTALKKINGPEAYQQYSDQFYRKVHSPNQQKSEQDIHILSSLVIAKA